ncbi:hypothetical protein [Comamonas thiooxydans]|uniref:hypothetical protein n=1 Tax=Comamonas thiooxydans TaxID=363952 RepID=UPI000B41AF05|nr:hypothetical protein [Comamonas thiooxydans]
MLEYTRSDLRMIRDTFILAVLTTFIFGALFAQSIRIPDFLPPFLKTEFIGLLAIVNLVLTVLSGFRALYIHTHTKEHGFLNG